jgi:putative transcriptional regulator
MATRSKTAESGILTSVHKAVAGFHEAGIIDKATLREFDALCLTPGEPLSPTRYGAAGAQAGLAAGIRA